MSIATFHIGGVIAIGFAQSGRYALIVSHDGRGVIDTRDWRIVARDRVPAYPECGKVEGIGPIAGQSVTVSEINYDDGTLRVISPNGNVDVSYAEGTIEVSAMGS